MRTKITSRTIAIKILQIFKVENRKINNLEFESFLKVLHMFCVAENPLRKFSPMSKGMDAATMRALGNHLVVLADSMGNIIPDTEGVVSKGVKKSGKVKKVNAKVEDNGVKARVVQKGDMMPTKRVVSKKTNTKLVGDKSKEGTSSAQESSSKENKIKTITTSKEVAKSVTKEKLKVTTDTEEKGRAKVNKKPANQKKQTNVINNDGEGQMIEKSIAKKPKVELQKKTPNENKRNTKAQTEVGVVMTLAKKEKVQLKKPKKTKNQSIEGENKTNGVGSKIEKKAVVKRPKEEKQHRAPPKKKQKVSTVTDKSSEFSINVQINMVEKKKKTAKK